MKEDTTMADSVVTPAELLSKLAESREFDFFREAMLSVLRELMEVEVSAKTVLLWASAVRIVSVSATDTGSGAWTPASAPFRSPSPSSERAATSPASWNPAGEARRHFWP
jgi:hypothetical protein